MWLNLEDLQASFQVLRALAHRGIDKHSLSELIHNTTLSVVHHTGQVRKNNTALPPPHLPTSSPNHHPGSDTSSRSRIYLNHLSTLLAGHFLPTKDYTTLKSPKGSGLKEHCGNPLFHKTGQVSREHRKNFVTSPISSRGPPLCLWIKTSDSQI